MKFRCGRLFLLAGLLLSVGLASPGWARTTHDCFRCPGGVHLVTKGDSRDDVLYKCGDPTGEARDGREWIYNFGPDHFVYYVYFEEDEVVRIESGDFGR